MMGLIALETEGCARARRELEIIEGSVGEQSDATQNAYLLHLSGRMHLAEGEGEKAVEDLRQAVKASPRFDRYDFKVELVKGYLDAGFTEDAVREGLALLEYNPNDGDVLSTVAFGYEQNSDPQQATAYLERALHTWKEADRDFLPLKEVQAKL
jgi:tetratricopeptide (TPR) repeat protein